MYFSFLNNKIYIHNEEIIIEELIIYLNKKYLNYSWMDLTILNELPF